MYKHFISLQWKAFFRSASLGKSIGLKIFMAFMAIYFSIVFLALGIGLYPLLQELYPDSTPIIVANSFVLVWLAVELFFRFMLQTLPIINIKPLLVAPIRKKSVVNYVLVKSLFSFYNLLPILVIVPFAIFTYVKEEFSLLSISAWAVAMICFTLSINYANFLLKKRFAEKIKTLIPFLIVAVILGVLEYYEIFEVSGYFGRGIDFILHNPLLVFVPVLILFGLFRWNQVNLEKKFYLDASLKQKTEAVDDKQFTWTRKFGDIAPFLQQDLKLIWRNKRPKTTIYLSLMILAYGLIFYPEESYQDMPTIFVFVGIFMTGIFMINFGQFIPAWDASYYPMIMSQNIPIRKYLASKAGLITVSVVLMTILATPYVYFGWNIFFMNIACALYNIGVNIPVLLYAGSYNKKRIDLEKSPFMNYQGTGATQWLISLPLILIPSLLFYLPYKFISYEAGVLCLAFLGVMGIFLRGYLMKLITAAYKKRKYDMLQGFKQVAD
ncbi:MAG TPA: DUF5687 family protein [Salinimicrobium sp.]|nr:DUF5687 family protein [Salinimicrobium sp.]